ncbi:hypothetical protein PMAYCL1PPCAC_19736 [Pristionchus mayeri]|uniref:Uncharacterized protein n=1 Tax=Pristionchus mayeri TaxID=1317129 RepID=A0AAN5CRW8_9BILA|nr:hypothetical protein PMAYCL1PPCAC_19736 [Pristionchus mayeri]
MGKRIEKTQIELGDSTLGTARTSLLGQIHCPKLIGNGYLTDNAKKNLRNTITEQKVVHLELIVRAAAISETVELLSYHIFSTRSQFLSILSR